MVSVQNLFTELILFFGKTLNNYIQFADKHILTAMHLCGITAMMGGTKHAAQMPLH